MNENLDDEMKNFREEIADSLGHTRKDEDIGHRKASLDFIPPKKTLIFGGAGIILLIIIIAIFSGGDNKRSTADLAPIQVRLDLLEKRLTRLEGVELKIASLEKQEKRLEQSIVETDRSKIDLTQRLDKLIQRFESLEKRIAPVPAKSKAPLAIQRKPISPAKKRYHEVSPGETLYRIAQQYGISVNELCRLNNITPKQAIHPGQKLLVAQDSHR